MRNTVIVGLGKVAAQYDKDPIMQKNIEYVTHAKVLANHPDFQWTGAVDISPNACDYVRQTWDVPNVATSLDELTNRDSVEILILATPPIGRENIIDYFSSLTGIIVEKPLGESYESSAEFIDQCAKRGIEVQVNLTRRSDRILKGLLGCGLTEQIGRVQFAVGNYGRGLRNYGIHLVDLVRMLIGEIQYVTCLSEKLNYEKGPIENDSNLSFLLETFEDVHVFFHPLDFSWYREGSLDIWGQSGRIEILHEGLNFTKTIIGNSRNQQGAFELSADQREIHPTGYGQALFHLYTNLSERLSGLSTLDSSGQSALKTEWIIESLFRSRNEGGTRIKCT